MTPCPLSASVNSDKYESPTENRTWTDGSYRIQLVEGKVKAGFQIAEAGES